MFEPKAVPFLKWIGGKRKFVPTLAPAIAEYLEESQGTYYEPFLGGGAMALSLGYEAMVLNDVIPDLVDTYKAIRDSPVEVALLLCELRDWGTDEDNYYAVRASVPDTAVDAAARMIYLNAHCFNGLWRTNKAGHMNAAYGKQSGKITDALLERIGKASEALHAGVVITRGDFEVSIRSAGAGDVIYADPPYDGTYVGYSGQGFCGVSQDRLASELYQAHRRGAVFICHNSSTDKVRNWYDYAHLVDAGEKRAVNRDGGGRGSVPCLLITNERKLLLHHLTS